MSGPAAITSDWIRERVRHFGLEDPTAEAVVWDDTSHYMAIERGHIVALQGEMFLVRCSEHEGRFGLEEQPKFWVKRALSLSSGRTYILKLPIEESFKVQVGAAEVLCVRDAEKEGKVLELVRGDARFMQGRSARDHEGHLVHIIEFLRGTDLLSYIDGVRMRHEEYCARMLPAVLAKVADNIAALQRLHDAGLCHGDIRNDHILVEEETGVYRWIDFDLRQASVEFDVWSVGNILHCVAAKGFVTFQDTLRLRPELSGRLSQDDASFFFPHRVMNLRKVFPYLPGKLNEVLLRFSCGARRRYEKVSQVADDLRECAAGG